jgi:hypothetical protein
MIKVQESICLEIMGSVMLRLNEEPTFQESGKPQAKPQNYHESVLDQQPVNNSAEQGNE